MGEFHDAVSTLLQAFSHGISIIKTQRLRRKKDRTAIDPSHKAAETHLSKSLRKSRSDVKHAYERDVEILGPGFQNGDEEAHFSLSSILLRLNAGFVTIIERFTRGKSTPADYQALVSLSNSSRLEAMRTFERLSGRLSQSSLALVPASNTHEKHKRKRNHAKGSSASGKTKHVRSRSTPELTVTPLGYASPEGWVRPKPGRKLSSESKSSHPSPKKRATKSRSPPPTDLKLLTTTKILSIPVPQVPIPHRPTRDREPLSSGPRNPQTVTVSRKSIMSFASDSTKLGEIPEYKWARPGMLGSEAHEFPITAFYPIEPLPQPEKQRSRFMRLFKKSGN